MSWGPVKVSTNIVAHDVDGCPSLKRNTSQSMSN